MNKNISILLKKYKDKNISGKTYTSLVRQILKIQSKEITNKALHLNKRFWDDLNLKNKKILSLPELSRMDTTRSIIALKSAEHGEMITQTIREELQNDIKSTLAQYRDEGIYNKRGIKAGALKPEIIKEIKNKMAETFSNYTKGRIPANIESIAITEARGSINKIKYAYAEQIEKSNENYDFSKTWIHNKALSKHPRIPHEKLNGKTIPFKDPFVYKDNKTGTEYTCLHPHDKILPASQIVHCSCDFKINIKKR